MIDTRHSINSTSTAARSAPLRTPAQTNGSDQPPATPAGAGEVSLSDRGRTLQALERAIVSTPDSSSARVAEIRAQLAEGSYQIDSMELAGKLLQSDWGR